MSFLRNNDYSISNDSVDLINVVIINLRPYSLIIEIVLLDYCLIWRPNYSKLMIGRSLLKIHGVQTQQQTARIDCTEIMFNVSFLFPTALIHE